jgi:2-hydroxy-4-carboxymuconate semialdehyde hemiacetal dehydrogenase
MNVALLGYGAIAREHALAIWRIGEASSRGPRLAGVMGRLPEPTRAFADEFGIALATTDLDELLSEPSIDAVIVCSPTDLHAEQTDRALRAGKHVLCEIPLATSLAETDRLIDLAAATGRCLMVCHTQRYTRPLMEARRLIGAGMVHPYALVARFLLDKRENISWTGRRRSWTDNLLWHHACHAVDAALWLLDAEATEVTARATPPDPRLHIPMDLSILMGTTRGLVVTVAMSYRALPPVLDYLVIGEETMLVCTASELRGHERVLVPAEDVGDYDRGAIDRQDAAFFEWVLGGREPSSIARGVRPAMAALQAAQNTLDQQGTRQS